MSGIMHQPDGGGFIPGYDAQGRYVAGVDRAGNPVYGDPGVPPPAQPPLPAVHDGLAIASLVLSLVWLWGLGSLLAVIFGHISRGNSKRTGRLTSGLATAGVVIGYIGLAIAIIVTIVLIAAAAQSNSYADCVQNAINNGQDPSVVCTP